MTEHASKPLDPEIAAWLRRAEPYPDAPLDVQGRVATALKVRIALDADAMTDGANDGSSDGPIGSAKDRPIGNASDGANDRSIGSAIDGSPAGTASPLASPSLSSSLGARLFATTARTATSLAVTFAVGGAVGAGLLQTLRPARERVVYVDRPAPAAHPIAPVQPGIPSAPTETEPPKEVSPAPPSDVPSPASGARAPARTAASTRGASVSDLEIEQKLLDVARTALARGQADSALAPLDRHAQRFPKGVLAEEREALAVNALVTLGRNDEARQRGARFLRRYPESLLRASVEAAIAAIP